MNDTGISARQVADLPFGDHLLGQLREGNRLDDDTEDAFAEVLRLEELGEAILGVPPRRRDKKDHRFATIDRTSQGGHPPLARCNAAAVIDVEKVVAPALGR